MNDRRETQTISCADNPDLPVEVWLRQEDAAAAFTPSEGCCCTALRVRRGDAWIAVLAEPPSWSALQGRPAFYGNPLLFPFAYGIRGGTFAYHGRTYELQPAREGRVLHGVVRDHGWVVERTWSDAQGTHLRASISNASGTDDVMLAQFPFPFLFRVTHTLQGVVLTSAFEATNLGSTPMPFGLGIHPYFPLPLTPDSSAGDYVIRADAAYVTTIRRRAEAHPTPAADVLDLRTGQRLDVYLRAACLEGKPLLDLYARHEDRGTRHRRAGADVSWAVQDTVRDTTVEIRTSDAFRYVLNFVPSSRVVLSPVLSTCPPGAFDLLEQGNTSGVIELPPGETWSAWTSIAVQVGS